MPTGLFSTCGITSISAWGVPDSCLSRRACALTSLPTHPPHLLRRREALSLLSTTDSMYKHQAPALDKKKITEAATPSLSPFSFVLPSGSVKKTPVMKS